MQKKYIVRLTETEREVCQDVIRKLKGSSSKVRRAQMLLKTDADGPCWPDERIADAFCCRRQTVERLRERCVTESFERALNGKKRKNPPTAPKLDGVGEAKLIAMRLAGFPQVGKPFSPNLFGPWPGHADASAGRTDAMAR